MDIGGGESVESRRGVGRLNPFFDWAVAATAMDATDRRDGRLGLWLELAGAVAGLGVETPEQACFNFKWRLSSHSFFPTSAKHKNQNQINFLKISFLAVDLKKKKLTCKSSCCMTVLPFDSGSAISALRALMLSKCLRQSKRRRATSFSSGSCIVCKSNDEPSRPFPKLTCRAAVPALNVLTAKSSTAGRVKCPSQT